MAKLIPAETVVASLRTSSERREKQPSFLLVFQPGLCGVLCTERADLSIWTVWYFLCKCTTRGRNAPPQQQLKPAERLRHDAWPALLSRETQTVAHTCKKTRVHKSLFGYRSSISTLSLIWFYDFLNLVGCDDGWIFESENPLYSVQVWGFPPLFFGQRGD